MLVGAFVPEAQGIVLVTEGGEEYPMVNEDEAGYFAALLPGDGAEIYYGLSPGPAGTGIKTPGRSSVTADHVQLAAMVCGASAGPGL